MRFSLSNRFGVAMLVVVAAQGCTHRAWYEGFQGSARHQCETLSSPEREDCLQQSGADYDVYKKEREGLE